MSLKVLRKMKSRAVLEMAPLPLVLEGRIAVEHRVEAEVHRAHVERAHLRPGPQRRRQALLQGHAVAAAGGDVDHRIAGLLDARQELHEHGGIGRRPAVLGIARMQMEDRRPGLGRLDRLLGDLVRRDRQMRRHGRRVDRSGDGAGDDHLAGFGHALSSPQVPMSSSASRLCAARAISRRSRQPWRSPSRSRGSSAARAGLQRVDRAGPRRDAVLRRPEPLIDPFVAPDIVAHAARRVEVDGLERADERPAQPDALLQADIDLFGRGVAVGDQAEGLLQQRALQAVHDEAVELAPHRRSAPGRSRPSEGAPARASRPPSTAPAPARPPVSDRAD